MASVASASPALLAPLPVAAQESCVPDDAGKWICRWTQLDNNDWPNSTTDPDCHAYCAFYISGQRYSYSDHVPMVVYGVDFERDMATAAGDWSGQPYNSPWFGNCNCPTGSAFLTLGQTDVKGGGACGVGWVRTAWQAQNVTNDNHVVSAEADFATNAGVPWFDGPPSPSFAGGHYCDALSVAYHEVGHAFGEGHSSVVPDVMYYGGGDLRTLYGAKSPSTPPVHIPCGPCRLPGTTASSSQVCNPPAPASVAECVAYNYLAKAWDLAHAGPVVDPSPIIGATPLASGCLSVALDYQAWVTCVLSWEGWK
jgi:hypothetical protein